MLWIYMALLAGMALLVIIPGRKRRTKFKKLDRKEHKLLIFYPAASWLAEIFYRYYPSGRAGHIGFLLRSICVKENIERERYLYYVKKTATVLAVITVALVLGLLTSLSSFGTGNIKSIERAEYGGGTDHYDLEAEYRGNEESITIDIEAVKKREAEILEIFENSYEAVKKLVLGDNESQDNVTEPLTLISSYAGFDIYWEIDDISAVNYNGDIKADLAGGESRILNLYAEFSMDDIKETFTIPIKLTGKEPSENELLIADIKHEIEENNDVYSKEVKLPEEINGYGISFKTKESDSSFLFIILGILGGAAVILLYDKSLEGRVKKRQEQMMQDFTEIVSKLSLLYDAGLSIHGAFERIVSDHDRISESENRPEERFAYSEMKLTLEKIKSGVSETQAYSQFGKRCGLYPYIKLGNLLEQNLNKGTKGMKVLLKQEVEEAFEERKRLARKKGEEAGTKMLLPMILLLMVVIIIVAVPALMAMNF